MASDVRIASSYIVDGPENLVGSEIVVVTPVSIDGVELHLPEALPGIPEYVTVARGEAEANRIRPTLLADLNEMGAIPFQPDASRRFDFYVSAGIAVTTAVAGLEAFANHHIARFCSPPQYDVTSERRRAI